MLWGYELWTTPGALLGAVTSVHPGKGHLGRDSKRGQRYILQCQHGRDGAGMAVWVPVPQTLASEIPLEPGCTASGWPSLSDPWAATGTTLGCLIPLEMGLNGS